MSTGRQIPDAEPAGGASWETAIGPGTEVGVGVEVLEVLDGPTGWTVRRIAETGSTNTDLLGAARLGAPDRTVLVTGHQTAGRGRLDRRWEAPPGANLLVSVLFRADDDLRHDPGLATRRIALAGASAAQQFTEGHVGLKWPNDLLLDGRKLGGILAQRAPDGAVVVGLGLNVGWAPPDAARLADDGHAIDPLDILSALLVALDRPEHGDEPHRIMTEYRARLDTVGRHVRVVLPDGELIGRALDVADDGRLVVLDECGITHRLDVGDVVHVRPAGDPD